MDDNFIKSLRVKEKELLQQLEQVPIFKQLEGLRTTIALFQNGTSVDGPNNGKPTLPEDFRIPTEFSDELSWRGKILFALSRIKSGFIPDLITELRKHGIDETDEFLTHRISTTISKLRNSSDLISTKKMGRNAKYTLRIKT